MINGGIQMKDRDEIRELLKRGWNSEYQCEQVIYELIQRARKDEHKKGWEGGRQSYDVENGTSMTYKEYEARTNKD